MSHTWPKGRENVPDRQKDRASICPPPPKKKVSLVYNEKWARSDMGITTSEIIL